MQQLLLPIPVGGHTGFAIGESARNQIRTIRIAARRGEKIGVESGIALGGFEEIPGQADVALEHCRPEGTGLKRFHLVAVGAFREIALESLA
jgi:hypothetical protein